MLDTVFKAAILFLFTLALAACHGSDSALPIAPSAAVSTDEKIDSAAELNRLTTLLQGSAQLPKLGEYKEENFYSAGYKVGGQICVYNINKKYSVTAVNSDSFQISSDSTALLNSNLNPSCPELPPNFSAHSVKNWKNADFIAERLEGLQEIFSHESPQLENWVQAVSLANSQKEDYQIGRETLSVQHIIIDLHAANGDITHLHYYFSLDSWFLGEIQFLQCENEDLPISEFVVSQYRPGN